MQVINDDAAFERTRKSFWITLPTWLIIIDIEFQQKTLTIQKVNFIYPDNAEVTTAEDIRWHCQWRRKIQNVQPNAEKQETNEEDEHGGLSITRTTSGDLSDTLMRVEVI